MKTVRMLRYIESFVQVRDLKPGELVELQDVVADQFVDNHIAEWPTRPAIADDRVEAAALTSARRRG